MKKLSLIIGSVFFILTFSQFSVAATKVEAKEVVNVKESKSNKVKVAARQAVNLNSANADEIANNLVGIGLKKAQTIVEYRQIHGEFKNVEDLALVKGIGVKTIEKNKGMILLN